MATAKKVAAKAAPKKPAAKAPARAVKAPARREQTYDMPLEVKDWIDQAMSRLKNMQNKIDALTVENKELKSYKRWAEHRILGSSQE